MKKKPFWLSKTFWVNVLAIIAMIIQYFTGWAFDPVIQATGLSVVNIILRAITKHPLGWGKGGSAMLVILVPIMAGAFITSTGCASLHDAALRKPVQLITCEYEGYVQKDKQLNPKDKAIRQHTAALLRKQVKAKPCPGNKD